MEEKKEEKLERREQIKSDYKKVNKIIFFPNEDVPDDWTDFEMTAEEFRALKEGEEYIEKQIIPNLSISKKYNPKDFKEEVEEEKEVKESELKEGEISEIDALLKAKAKSLKEDKEKETKKEKLEKEEEEKKKQREISLNEK